MNRKHLSPASKAALLERQGGVCAACGEPGESWEYDHVIPLALGGEDSVANLEAVHTACHRQKTSLDVKRISKAKRLAKTQAGERSRARKGPPLKSKPFRIWKAMDGTVRYKDGSR